MSDAEHLRETLDELHQQLAASGDLSEESRKLLQEALEDIRGKLAASQQPSERAPEPTGFADRLREGIHHFEDTHPDLVRAVDRVARALANVGF